MTVELCWRCGAAMEWIYSTWQCGRCRLKLGCCEGEPQSACAPQSSGNRLRSDARLAANQDELVAGKAESEPN
jgi:hypothetical protein